LKTIGAFFDFDRTLIDVESPKLGIRYLWDRGYVSLSYVVKIIAAHFFYEHNMISDESMARMLISFYRGKSLDVFEAGSPTYYEEIIKPHLAPNILAKVKMHKELGHLLVLISASLKYLLKPVAQDLGFHHLLCSDLEVGADGLLTGRTIGPICSDKYKRTFARRLAEESNMDLGASYAYGDHHADIPLLELVGHPTAVEPTEKLRKVALERGWPILGYR
jgi:HAD superfamily hydrolase (TIGR01490 family)